MGRFVREDAMWRIDPKYIACCGKCGREGLKRNMVSLYVKRDSYSPMRIMCHFCPNCLVDLADELGVAVPE